jgi:undecaprenyl-diphosphatase
MDQHLLFLINRQWTHPALDWFMAALSSFAVWAPVLAVVVVLLLVRGDFRMRAFVVAAALAVAVNDGVVSRSLKRIVDRPRPHQALDGVRQVDLAKARPRLLALGRTPTVKTSRAAEADVEGRSFPSSHTMNCFAVALVACGLFGKRAWWTFGIAALVGYSRIYTGAHWPSDVLTSMLLGAGVTLLVLALAEWLWQRIGARYLRQTHARHPTLLAR